MPEDKNTIELYRCTSGDFITGRCFVMTGEAGIHVHKRCDCQAELWRRESTLKKPRKMSDFRFVLTWTLGSILGGIAAVFLLYMIIEVI